MSIKSSRIRLPITLALICALLLPLSGSKPFTSRARSASPQPPSVVVKDKDHDEKDKPCKEERDKKDKDKDRDKDKDDDRDPCRPAGGSSGVAKGDFDGDGFGDLAIGVPFEDINGIQNAGAVQIIYGSSAGLVTEAGRIGLSRTTFFNLDVIFGTGTGHLGDEFGSALASGDFNGDGRSDLAIGVPGFDLFGGSVSNAGAVNVLYGTSTGLKTTNSPIFAQGSGGILDAAEANDRFGSVLAWGDFDGDGFGDLAVGVPDEDIPTRANTGAVHIIYGSSAGLTVTRNQFWTQDTSGIFETSQTNDAFGSALAGGDFNGDGKSDLAIGVPGENVSGKAGAGAVHVLYGSALNGLTEEGDQFWTQDTAGANNVGILDQAEEFDHFGSSLAAGTFTTSFSASNSTFTDDLAIGVPFEDIPLLNSNSNIANAGAVNVIYGSTSGGLSIAGNQFWTQDSPGIPDNAEEGDRFGTTLAAGDLDKNTDSRSEDDLAIGVPFEDVGNVLDAGAVNIIYGSVIVGGLTTDTAFASAPQFYNQDTTGVLDVAEVGDRFGSSLTAWNFGKGAPADLAIGVPFEDVGSINDAGAVNVLYGTDGFDFNSIGLDPAGNQLWTQDTRDIPDACEAGDQFGSALY